MKRNTNLGYWPDHLHPIFAAIDAATDGKRLHPDILERVDGRAIIPDHKVSVRHHSGELGPAGNHYVIEVDGPRIVGTWHFRSGELERLARATRTTTASASS
jgi:hypothetical protein